MQFSQSVQLELVREPKGSRRILFGSAMRRVGRYAHGYFLYWEHPLTRQAIQFRRARRWLNRFELIGGVVFGLGFFLVFGWSIWKNFTVTQITSVYIWNELQTASFVGFFWLGVIGLSFAIYRGHASKRKIVEVVGNDEPEASSQIVVQTWKSIRKVKHSKRFNIAKSFTDDARSALEDAYRLADKQESAVVNPHHIFHSLLSSQSIAGVFVRLGIPARSLQAALTKGFHKDETRKTPIFSDEAEQILFHAYDNALSARQEYVHVTELLVATVEHSTQIQELLYDLDVDQQKLSNVIEWLRIRERLRRQFRTLQKAGSRRSKYGMDKAMTAVATPYLNSFSQDLTIAAKYGQLSPCVARDKEIEEIFRIIEGGRQSIVLVGDSGVGKMSIIEGIAQRMVEDTVPERLKDKRLVQLSTSALMAGATVSGAQERLIRIMNELGRARNIILCVKNIHDLMSAQSTGGGEGLDVSETLSEYLGPGQFLTLATTTTEGFNKYVTNSELGSVLARVNVKEMDQNQTIQVLESKVGVTEYKHKVFFSYDALEQSAALAERFLHDEQLPESAIALMTESASYAKNKNGESQLVSKDDVASVVSSKTGVPTTSITADESTKLMNLEEEMHKRVIGQDMAVTLVANALRRARANMRSQKRPIANFLFLGPTGVGKTELAKVIASVYFGGEQRMIRVDMSEFQDISGIHRLIGQPGAQGTGLLTEAVRQQPFSLILLDELEKAHPDILNLFLQVFDDGRLTDSVGRVIDFTNSIIIATSNAATEYVQSQIVAGTPLETIREALMRTELKQYYRPEFLNRFDGIVLFKSLTRDETKQIARLMLGRVARDLETRGISLRIEDLGLEALAKVGYDPAFGARPMRRAIQEHVENPLAELLLSNTLNRRDTIVLGKGAKLSVEST